MPDLTLYLGFTGSGGGYGGGGGRYGGGSHGGGGGYGGQGMCAVSISFSKCLFCKRRNELFLCDVCFYDPLVLNPVCDMLRV